MTLKRNPTSALKRSPTSALKGKPTMTLKRNPTMALQLGFLALLAISTAQIAWWIADTRNLAREQRVRVEALYEADALAVTAAFAQATEQLPEMMPHLEIDAEQGTATVRPESLEALAEEAGSRINRYTWEGGFFLLVLLGGMTVLTRTIRHDAHLRKRQQNFLAAVSHELKSPLASIRLAAESLTRMSGGVRSGGSRPRASCSSPELNIWRTMSQPPMNSPST